MLNIKSSIAVVFLLSACEALPHDGAHTEQSLEGQVSLAIEDFSGAPQPQGAGEVAFIKAQLNAIQPRSIAENREYCGYMGRLPNGALAISGPRRGEPAGCTPDNPPANMRIIASYHTHAAYAPNYDSEVPSATDVEGDIAEGINGYVATPGGRMWFIDGAARRTSQVCGIGCLVADPRFRPEPNPVRQSYALAELRQRQN